VLVFGGRVPKSFLNTKNLGTGKEKKKSEFVSG
jgi:hypothetical protein